ncbi:hypothetical protein EU537_02215 [Candidatus Thorarchaeota archaeon]|nr:MAG: hypothetical protein EU537_02215 [Candidatus Thorarchaeota archaeon]
MIVVEDRDNGEIIRFFLVDANVNLGCIKAGNLEQEFGPERLLRYYNHLEDRIYEYAARYPDSFAYLPRQAYRYLMQPKAFKTISTGSMGETDHIWLADQFVGTALSSVSSKRLDTKQSIENARKVQKLATTSNFSMRLYALSDLGLALSKDEHWGLISDVHLLENLDDAAQKMLKNAIRINLPIFVRLHKQQDITKLVAWLISVKERGLEPPKVLLIPHVLKKFNDNLLRLLDIPNTCLITTNASISNLSSVISGLKKNHPQNWAKKLAFGSGYPETQRGNSLSEIISFLLSRNLDLDHRELQLILGGNMLRLLPGRPPFLSFIETKSMVQARQHLGKVASGEISRIFRVIRRKDMRSFCSCDFFLEDEGGIVATNKAFLSVTKPGEKIATGIGLLTDQEDALELHGWNEGLSQYVDSRNAQGFLQTIESSLAANTKTLTDINDLQVFTDRVLESLRIGADEDVASSLHFILGTGVEEGINVSLHPQDMIALGLEEGDIIIILESNSRRWWGARACPNEHLDKRHLSTSRKVAEILNLKEDSRVDVLKYARDVCHPSDVVVKYDALPQSVSPILPSFFHLHESAIENILGTVFLGEGTNYKVVIGNRKINLELQSTKPEMEPGDLCDIKHSDIKFVPKCLMEEFNLIICLETSERMVVKNIPMNGPATVRARLNEGRLQSDGLKKLEERIQEQISMADASIAAILILLNSMVENRTLGRFSFLTYDKKIRKFTIQKGHDLDTSIGFKTEFSAKEVRDSLFYSVIDSAQEMIGSSNPELVHRAVAESLEDFGSDRPTLVMVFASEWSKDAEGSLPFLRAISKSENYQIDVFLPEQNKLSKGQSGNNLKISFHSLERFSLHEFDKYVLKTVDELLKKST